MATGVTTLISSRMLASRGRWGLRRVAPPIAASDIRRWAIATYWPQTPPRIYWDDDYARTTRWGGIVAPPDFNPFAWPIERPPPPRATEPETETPLARMNGGQVETYGVRMRPGDVIRTRSRLAEVNEREGRFGLMLFLVSETEWVNQAGEFVRRRMSTLIRY